MTIPDRVECSHSLLDSVRGATGLLRPVFRCHLCRTVLQYKQPRFRDDQAKLQSWIDKTCGKLRLILLGLLRDAFRLKSPDPRN